MANKKNSKSTYKIELAEAKKELLITRNANRVTTVGQIILGAQDGIVNVLGIVLGIAIATNNSILVLLAGFAGASAESISMAAVAYTTAKTRKDYYDAMWAKEEYEIKVMPRIEKLEVRVIYSEKGFRGKALDNIVKTVCSDKNLWIKTMMKEEHGLSESENEHPVKEGIVVGLSAFIGSILPLIVFVFVPLISVTEASIASIVLSAIVLFGIGYYKGKIIGRGIFKSGIELAIIGIIAAIVGFLIGVVFTII